MRKGFTIIEVVIAIFLASLISLSLFQLLNQVRRAVKRITNVIDVDMPLIGFYNQVEKDVTGMFAPFSSMEVFINKDKEAAKQKEREKIPFMPDKKDAPLVSKPIENVFELEVKGTSFFWSFITTGGIQVLDAEGNVAPVPFVRRVAYVLESDPQQEGLYRLMYRFSGTNLELKDFQSADFTPSYELVNGIKQLGIEVTVLQVVEKEVKPDDKKGDKKDAKKEAPKKPQKEVISTRTVTIKEWKPEEIWEKYKTLIPAYVKLSGTRVDVSGIEYPFEIVNKVYAYSPYVEKEKSLFEALEDIAKKIWKK